jgi:aminopeptidase YwaD
MKTDSVLTSVVILTLFLISLSWTQTAITTFTIKSSAEANGTISPTPSLTVNYGDNQHFSVVPNIGFKVDSLFVDGASVTPDTQYTFSNITSNHTIYVSFVVPKSPPVIDVNPAIQTLVNQVSVDSVTSIMRRLEAFKLRWVLAQEGLDSLARTRDWIIAKMQSYGYTDILQQNFDYAGTALQNIIVTKTGSVYPDSQLILGNHYDTVNGPGVDDNGSGVALTLEIARILASRNFNYTIKFMFFSAEEEGFSGSRAYVQNIAAPRHDYIRLMTNIDMVGFSGGESYVNTLVDTNNTASKAFADTLAILTELYSTLSSRMENVNNSDIATFSYAGYATTGFFEAVLNPHYHQQSDSLRYCDTNYAAQVAKAAIAGLAHFAVSRFTIVSSAGPNGTITPNGITTLSFNETLHFSIAPNPGYHVDSLVIDGAKITSDTQYTFTGISADHTIRATFTITDTTDVHNMISAIPDEYTLHQNYPNPFNPTTTIRYVLSRSGHVTLTVYNILGEQVALLVDAHQQAGFHDVTFDGQELSSGVYYYRIQAGSFSDVKKLLLLK